VKYQFIADHQADFEVRVMCRVMGVSRSGFYAWGKRPDSPRKMANDQLWPQIEAIYQRSRQTYGSLRIQAELAGQKVVCGHNRVARLMRQHGLKAKQSRRFRAKTTDSSHDLPVAPNLLNQEFSAEAPNEKWSGDITYIPTAEGWLYLAVLIDLFSRRIVGWAMSAHPDRFLVLAALEMALETRQPPPGLIVHSDRGSQYASKDYQALLEKHHLRCSMSRAGNCYDNAPTESFFGTLKTEQVHHCHYATRAEAKTDLFEYIEAFYNRSRRHSTLGYLCPMVFENLALKS
jgi:putative transposase